jgi:hypothetical protein
MKIPTSKLLEADAVVLGVDLVNRRLAALAAGAPVNIYVSPHCHVILHGERVKLRMVQPKDRLRVRYEQVADGLVAERIEIRPAH